METEPEQVKKILREALRKKIGVKEEEMTGEPEYQKEWVRKNEKLRGSYGKLLVKVTKVEVRGFWRRRVIQQQQEQTG